MDKFIAEIKRTKEQVTRGFGMFMILCLAFLLGTLRMVGADEYFNGRR